MASSLVSSPQYFRLDLESVEEEDDVLVMEGVVGVDVTDDDGVEGEREVLPPPWEVLADIFDLLSVILSVLLKWFHCVKTSFSSIKTDKDEEVVPLGVLDLKNQAIVMMKSSKVERECIEDTFHVITKKSWTFFLFNNCMTDSSSLHLFSSSHYP